MPELTGRSLALWLKLTGRVRQTPWDTQGQATLCVIPSVVFPVPLSDPALAPERFMVARTGCRRHGGIPHHTLHSQ